MHDLNETRIRTIAPTGKTQRHFDGAGPYLEVSPQGARWWRWKHRFRGMSLCRRPGVPISPSRTPAPRTSRCARSR